MTGRSNWEHKNSVLDRLDPSRRAEAEARAASRKGVSNEAIKIEPKKAPSSDVKAVPTPGLLGDGAASNAMRKVRSRLPE